jgi:hypothetical protein
VNRAPVGKAPVCVLPISKARHTSTLALNSPVDNSDPSPFPTFMTPSPYHSSHHNSKESHQASDNCHKETGRQRRWFWEGKGREGKVRRGPDPQLSAKTLLRVSRRAPAFPDKRAHAHVPSLPHLRVRGSGSPSCCTWHVYLCSSPESTTTATHFWKVPSPAGLVSTSSMSWLRSSPSRCQVRVISEG